MFDGLSRLRLPEEIAKLRGKNLGKTEIAKRIERSRKLTGVGAASATEPEAENEKTGGEAS